MTRSTREVVEDHLRRRRVGDLEGDLAHNYHPHVRLMSAEGINHGHDGVRKLAQILNSYLPESEYRYHQILHDGDVAMLAWTGRSADTKVHDGADTYVVRDGLIVTQTIHYSTAPNR